MADRTSRECQCAACVTGEKHADFEHHRRINLLMSRLDEQQRRWFAAVESKKIGHGGDVLLSQITGLHVDTIRRGREELDADLADRPSRRAHSPAGRRPAAVEKKDPEIVSVLTRLAEPVTGGDPMSGAKEPSINYFQSADLRSAA